MQIYLTFEVMRRYLHWKTYLVILAFVIVAFALYNFNKMAKEMSVEEQKKVETLVEGFKSVSSASIALSSNDITFASKIITENTTIPLIITDKDGNIISNTNLDSAKAQKNPDYLKLKLKEFKALHTPLLVDYQYGKNYVYYGDSELLGRLKNYPLFIISITFVFLLIALIAFSNAQKSIQNQVWVGMSKETAHQLGTPLSSIVAWMELLKEKEDNRAWIEEMEKDVNRLKLIADRFSKIGSKPQLEEENVIARLEGMVEYMQKRAPQKVLIQFDYEAEENRANILLSGPLFEWVIENLMRNALDAMEGSGLITVHLKNEPRLITIDLSNTGKPISKKNFKKIFTPGFSTKKRGWGLGLSLSKRIIEEYHNGSIFVKHSDLNKTTFRIILRR